MDWLHNGRVLVSFREIEGIWDRYREIRRTLVILIRCWMNLGKVVRVWERLKGSWIDMERLEELGRIDWMLDNAWEKLKRFKRDIDRLADFWKEWLDIGLILDWIEGMLDRYGEMVRIWKDSLDNERIWKDWLDIGRLLERLIRH